MECKTSSGALFYSLFYFYFNSIIHKSYDQDYQRTMQEYRQDP